VIKKKSPDAMDPTKNLRYVEGEEESVGLSSDSCENENENEVEIEDEIEKIATQKNRERFAIKKTYSVEVCISVIKMHQCIDFSTFYF
jgi:hypothetical protein